MDPLKLPFSSLSCLTPPLAPSQLRGGPELGFPLLSNSGSGGLRTLTCSQFPSSLSLPLLEEKELGVGAEGGVPLN